ncbi:transposase, MuDR, MULE transposase domain protein [Tanacetum coccineum]
MAVVSCEGDDDGVDSRDDGVEMGRGGEVAVVERAAVLRASMNLLQIVQPDAYKKLCDARPERWSRAHCPLIRYNYMTSNSVESVNACSVIYRKEPVLKLAETYRAMVQQWYYERRKLAANMTYEITDWAAHKVGKKSMKSTKWVVKGVNEYQYEVSDSQYIREVNLQAGTCECRKWQLSGIPCGHVIAVTRFLGLTDCVQYVSDWFKKPKYQGTYSESIHFLGNMQQWEFLKNIHKAIPPRMDNPQPGHPKNTKRIQSQGEEPRVIHCSRCTQAGHRRDQCNKPFVVESPVNIRTQNDQEILRNNQPSFYDPNQQFTSPPRREFVDEVVATVDPVELDTFSTDQVSYDQNSPTFLYIKKPNCSFDSGLVRLADAIQERDMILINPEQVRLNVLTKLQEALDEEAILEEQILALMHRFADRFTDRRVEINNLMVLHDHPLIEYGKYALGCMTGADMKKCVYLKSVRDELLRSMEEKRQLMTNYRDM